MSWWAMSRREKYHFEGPNWLHNGRALCGRVIDLPAFHLMYLPEDNEYLQGRACAQCKKRVKNIAKNLKELII